MTFPYETLLRRAQQGGEVVSIHYDRADFDNVYCGYVESLTPEECRMRLLTRYGLADGWRAFRLADILLVDHGGMYEDRIAYFAKTAVCVFPLPQLEQIENDPIIAGTLRQASERGLFVTVWLSGGAYSLGGRVLAVSEEGVSIEEHDTFGVRNGLSAVQLADIGYVLCGTADNVRAQHLAEHQEEFLEFRRRQSK